MLQYRHRDDRKQKPPCKTSKVFLSSLFKNVMLTNNTHRYDQASYMLMLDTLEPWQKFRKTINRTKRSCLCHSSEPRQFSCVHCGRFWFYLFNFLTCMRFLSWRKRRHLKSCSGHLVLMFCFVFLIFCMNNLFFIFCLI